MTAVLLASAWGGTSFAWDSAQVIARRRDRGRRRSRPSSSSSAASPEPLLPLGLFRSRTFSVSTASALLIGGVLFGITIYVPVYVQRVLGASATGSGVVLIPLSLRLGAGEHDLGPADLAHRAATASFPLIGSVLVLTGCILLALLDENSSRLAVTFALTIVGIGMGTMFQTFVIATQNRVDFADLGVATAAIQFFRSMGGSLAVAGLGALLIARLDGGLASATHAVFVAIVPLAALIVVFAVLLPEHELRTTAPSG